MDEKLRFGVIGTSPFNQLHIKTINSHANAEVVSICGRNAERAQTVASENGVSHVYSDYRDLIEKNNLDGVVVGTPDYLHHEMVLAAAQAGLHIGCEKPLAQNLGQAMEMLQAAESAKLHHLTYFTYRWVPHYEKLKQLISEGYIGKILSAEFSYVQGAIPSSEGEYDWHYDAERGTGVLGNIGSHVIYLAQWLVGDINTVAALSATHFDRVGADNDAPQLDDTVFMTVGFAGDAIGSIHATASAATPGQEQLICIRGTKGTLEAGLANDGAWLKGAPAGEKPQPMYGPDDLWGDIDLSKDSLGRFLEIIQTQSIADRLLIDDILSGTQSHPNLRDGVRVQAVMEAARRSSTTGQAETVADF